MSGQMPAGLIDRQRGVRPRRDLGGDFGEMEVHRLRVAAWHDERRAFAVLRTDRAEDISRGGSRSAWTAPRLAQRRVIVFFWPTRASSANQFYGPGLDVLRAPDRFQARGKAYGMARPSFRRRRVAGGSGGGMGMDISVLGVDLGKNICSVVGLDASGAVVLRRRAKELCRKLGDGVN